MRTNIKNIFLFTTALVASSFLFMRCDSGEEFENATQNSVDINLSGELIQGSQNMLVVDETNPSNSYSRVDSITQYGFGTQFNLPDSLKDCGLKLVVSGKMRETESITGYIAIALHGKDTMHYWGNVFARVGKPSITMQELIIDLLGEISVCQVKERGETLIDLGEPDFTILPSSKERES